METEYKLRNRESWTAALNTAFPKSIPKSCSWTDPKSIVRILNTFADKNLNHTMLPGGGGQDIITVAKGRKNDCIEFCLSPRLAYIGLPATLHFEHFAESPWNSFLLLELGTLQPSGVYKNLAFPREELLEMPNGEYRNRSYLDQGSMGEDEYGHEIPIPEPHRLVVRYLKGKFLMVAKSSLWNLATSTYDGRHNEMSADEIRGVIQHALDQLETTTVNK